MPFYQLVRNWTLFLSICIDSKDLQSNFEVLVACGFAPTIHCASYNRVKGGAEGLKIQNIKNLILGKEMLSKNIKFLLVTFFSKSIHLRCGNVIQNGHAQLEFEHWVLDEPP